jgi:hypothetical protein
VACRHCNDHFEASVSGAFRQHDQAAALIVCNPRYGLFDLSIVANTGGGHFHSEQASGTLGVTQERFRIGRCVWIE